MKQHEEKVDLVVAEIRREICQKIEIYGYSISIEGLNSKNPKVIQRYLDGTEKSNYDRGIR